MLAKNFANRPAVAICGLVLLLCALPGAALATEKGWTLRFGAVGLSSELDNDSVGGFGRHTYARDGSVGGGLGVSGEYRFSPRLGFEIGAMTAATVDVNVAYPDAPYASNALTFTPIIVGLNIHLTPESKVDVYLGPLLAYVFYEDLNYSSYDWNWDWQAPHHVDYGIDNDFAVGANLGLDIRFGASNWMLTTGLKYLDTSVDARSHDGSRAEVEFDPVIFSLGAGYRF